MENEVRNLEKLMHNAPRPFTAIIGGSKVSSKIGILENLLADFGKFPLRTVSVGKPIGVHTLTVAVLNGLETDFVALHKTLFFVI